MSTSLHELAAESIETSRWLASAEGKRVEAIREAMRPCVEWARPIHRDLDADPVVKAALAFVFERASRLHVQVVEDEARWMTGGVVKGLAEAMVEELGLALKGRMVWGVL